MILDEIRDRVNDFVKVTFWFEVREANFEAHALSKAASSLPEGRHMWLGIPPNITCILDVLINEKILSFPKKRHSVSSTQLVAQAARRISRPRRPTTT